MRHHRLRLDPLRQVRSGPLSSARLIVAVVALGFVGWPGLVHAWAEPVVAEAVPPAEGSGGSVAVGRLVLVHRVLAQDQGDWQVDYSFRNAGAEPLVLEPKDVRVQVEGWLSNSRIAAHATPRRAVCVIDGQVAASALAEVLAAPEESKRCRERVVVALSAGTAPNAAGGQVSAVVSPNPDSATATKPTTRGGPVLLAPVTVEAGDLVRVRVRLEHQHILHGDYDPLLGRRDVELRLASFTFRDALPFDREQYRAMPRGTWPEPPDDRKDARHFVTGPDSLHLDADLPGANYYRFPERQVRYGTRMRLRFWYRVAPGTEGELHARVAQYRESPESWKVLSDGGSDVHLTNTTGSWVRFEKIIRTEAEATTLALDFRISPCDVGEAWIDDVVLEPAEAPAGGP